MSEELDHLILLSIMTIFFAVCSLPFTIHAFMNHFSKDYQEKDLLVAMRFLSVNSIVNPWAFVILRPPILRHHTGRRYHHSTWAVYIITGKPGLQNAGKKTSLRKPSSFQVVHNLAEMNYFYENRSMQEDV
ncbi:hypothetical protein L345_00848, partial [Ophiophagus hannah]